MTTLAQQLGRRKRAQGMRELREENDRLRDGLRLTAQLLTSWNGKTTLASENPMLWDVLVRSGCEAWRVLDEDPGPFGQSMIDAGVWPGQGGDDD